MDAGKIVQKILIKGIDYNVGGLPSPAMKDSKMCEMLNLDPDYLLPVYSVTMGSILPEHDTVPIDSNT